jgi:superfamily II DNA or RNA helicase
MPVEWHSYIKPCLSFPAVYYREGRFKKHRGDYRKAVFTKGKNFLNFPAGLVPKVSGWLKERNITPEIVGEFEKIPYNWPPKLKGIEFRKDQKRLIARALRRQRGVLKSPTRSGKTVVAMGIMDCLRGSDILFLCHTKDLLMQTRDELERFGFGPIGTVGMGKKELGYTYTVATMQSFKKVPMNEWASYWDAVFVDECHHVSMFNGTYVKILKELTTPFRIGLTATLPEKEEAKMALEGYIGRLIGEVTIEEAAEIGILAEPKIKLLKSEYKQKVKDLRRYPEVYEDGIVKNGQRNRMILIEANKYIKLGSTVLILVTKVEHGELLKETASRVLGLDVEFVWGGTKSETRNILKKKLESKKISCVIANVVWKEGVNIPSLDVLINAAGGKSELQTLQSVGRVLTKTEDKDKGIIIDVFDPSHHYLVNHFGERITLYMENNWL